MTYKPVDVGPRRREALAINLELRTISIDVGVADAARCCTCNGKKDGKEDVYRHVQYYT